MAIAPWREAHPQDAVNIDEETTRSYLAERETELRDLVQGGFAVSRDDLAEEIGGWPCQKHTYVAIANAADKEIANRTQKKLAQKKTDDEWAAWEDDRKKPKPSAPVSDYEMPKSD